MRKGRTSRLRSTWAVECDITSVLAMQFRQVSISCIYQILIYPKAAVRTGIGAFGTMALMFTGRWSGSTSSCAGINDTLGSKTAEPSEQPHCSIGRPKPLQDAADRLKRASPGGYSSPLPVVLLARCCCRDGRKLA